LFWKKIDIAVPAEAAEAVYPILYNQGAEGCHEAESKGKRVITCYLPWDLSCDRRIKHIKSSVRRLRFFGLGAAKGKVQVSIYDDGVPVPWSNLDPGAPIPPTRFGSSIVVKGKDEPYEERHGDCIINLVPGPAWGTGHHPTTEMCLTELEKAIRGGERVIDLGCGTGLLGMVAARLGASDVLAIDVEQEAVDNAAANIELNGLGAVMRAVRNDGLSGIEYTAHILIANLLASLLEAMAEDLWRHTGPGGSLICSGIERSHQAKVMLRLSKVGFKLVEMKSRDRWAALVFRKV
jgi:ribosomal protein L11 methyltransferase